MTGARCLEPACQHSARLQHGQADTNTSLIGHCSRAVVPVITTNPGRLKNLPEWLKEHFVPQGIRMVSRCC
jgi:hypothetical protein